MQDSLYFLGEGGCLWAGQVLFVLEFVIVDSEN